MKEEKVKKKVKQHNTQFKRDILNNVRWKKCRTGLKYTHYAAAQRREQSKSLIPALGESGRWIWWPTWRGGEGGSVPRRSISPSPPPSSSLSLLPRWLIWVTQSAWGHFKAHFIQQSRTLMWSAFTDQLIARQQVTPTNSDTRECSVGSEVCGCEDMQ